MKNLKKQIIVPLTSSVVSSITAFCTYSNMVEGDWYATEESEGYTRVVENSEEYKALMAKLSEAESKLETENSEMRENITKLKASITQLIAELEAESYSFAFDENGNLNHGPIFVVEICFRPTLADNNPNPNDDDKFIVELDNDPMPEDDDDGSVDMNL